MDHHQPSPVAGDTEVDLEVLFPGMDGAAAGELEQYADVHITKNGTTVFTRRTTVGALVSPLQLVSEALSLLNHPDPQILNHLNDELCHWTCTTAEVAGLFGWGIRLTAHISFDDRPSPYSSDGGGACLPLMKSVLYRGGQFRATACAICLDGFKEGMRVGRMPCSHIFHGHCITRWLRLNHLCPLCRSTCKEFEEEYM